MASQTRNFLDIGRDSTTKIRAVSVHSFLVALVLLLTVLVVSISLFQKLRLGLIVGLIVAGIALGPWGLHVAPDVERLFDFTQLGVVLLMFTIGLEMAPRQLWMMRRLVFGLGTLQLLVTGCFLTLLLLTREFPWRGSLLGGLGLALSSTAFGMPILHERGETESAHGRAAFAILLAQDLAIVPLLALIPLLAHESASGQAVPIRVLEVLLALGTVAAVGARILPLLLRYLHSLDNPHAFAALVFLAIGGIALLMEWVGLSMALGAFLLGMFLSGSDFRQRIDSIVSPLKAALLDLFFIAVGMSMNLQILVQVGWIMILRVVVILLVKTLVLYLLARGFGYGRDDAIKIGALLSNSGEFGFVLFGAAQAAGIVSPAGFNLAALAISLSLAFTPLMVKLGDFLCRKPPVEKSAPS